MSDQPDAELPGDHGIAVFLQACRERPASMVAAIKALYEDRTLPLEARWAIATLECRMMAVTTIDDAAATASARRF